MGKLWFFLGFLVLLVPQAKDLKQIHILILRLIFQGLLQLVPNHFMGKLLFSKDKSVKLLNPNFVIFFQHFLRFSRGFPRAFPGIAATVFSFPCNALASWA